MFIVRCSALAALCLIVSGPLRAEEPLPRYRMDARIYQIDTTAKELMKRALSEHSKDMLPPVGAEDNQDFYVLDESFVIQNDLIALTVAGPELRIEAASGAGPELCKVLASPCVQIRAKEKTVIESITEEPLHYLKKREDGLFELAVEFLRLGWRMELTIRPVPEGGDLVLDFNLSTSTNGGVRLPIEGVALEAGKPIVDKREIQGTLRTKAGRWVAVFPPSRKDSSLCVFLRTMSGGETPAPKQFTISSRVVRIVSDAQGNLPEAPDSASRDFFAWVTQQQAGENRPGQEPGAAIRLWSSFPNLRIRDLCQSLELAGAELMSVPHVTTTEASSKPIPARTETLQEGEIQRAGAVSFLDLFQGTAIEPFIREPKKGLALICDMESTKNPETGAQRFEKGCALAFEIASASDPGQIQLAVGNCYRFDDFRWERRGIFRLLKRVPAETGQCGLYIRMAFKKGDGLILAQRMPVSKDAVVTLIAVQETPKEGEEPLKDPFGE